MRTTTTDTMREIAESIRRGTPVTTDGVTWIQLQQVDNLLLCEEDLAGYESARVLINRAVGGDRAAKARCVGILNAHLAPEVTR